MTNPYKINDDVYGIALDEQKFGGSKRKQAIDWSKAERQLDFKTDFFKPDSGESYKLNILPFIVKSPLNPYVIKGKAKVGGASYLLDIYKHSFIGPGQDEVLCPKMNYGKACPICEERELQLKSATTDEEKKAIDKALKPKRRALLNVQLIDSRGNAQPPQVMDISHARFMQELLEEAKVQQKDHRPRPFADPEEGDIIGFRCSHSDLSKKDITFKNFTFTQRKEEIEQSVLQQSVSFDALLVVLSEKEIAAILYGQDLPAEEADEPKATEKVAEKAPVKQEAPKQTCPAGMNFCEDFESDARSCDMCSEENTATWKACRKANIALDNSPY